MGQVRAGGIRVENHGKDVKSAELGKRRAWGDKVEVVVARVDEQGRPEGNRQDRRLCRRLMRRQK